MTFLTIKIGSFTLLISHRENHVSSNNRFNRNNSITTPLWSQHQTRLLNLNWNSDSNAQWSNRINEKWWRTAVGLTWERIFHWGRRLEFPCNLPGNRRECLPSPGAAERASTTSIAASAAASFLFFFYSTLGKWVFFSSSFGLPPSMRWQCDPSASKFKNWHRYFKKNLWRNSNSHFGYPNA